MASSTSGARSSADLRDCLALARRDARRRLEQGHLQRLRPAAPLGDAELHAGPALEGRDTLRQRVRVQEDVAAVVVGDEAEALLRVVPLDLASGHLSTS